MLFDNNESYIALNNALNNKSNYVITTECININTKTTIIGTIYTDNEMILKINYSFLGTYDITKNIWVWASNSYTLNNNLITDNKHCREYFYNNIHEHKQFIKDNISIVEFSKLNKIIFLFASSIYIWKKYKLLTFKKTNTLIDIYIVKSILFESIL